MRVSGFVRRQVVASRDKRVLRTQRKWRGGRRGTRGRRPVRATTEAFSFSPPEELDERMKLYTAWAYLRRGALLVREVRHTLWTGTGHGRTLRYVLAIGYLMLYFSHRL